MNSQDKIVLHYAVDGSDFSIAGEASSNVKKVLKQLGVCPDIVRRVSISMYEAEINMVIHAHGGTADVEISPEEIFIVLEDKGPGIPDISLAMTEGFSTASDDVRSLGFGAGMGLPNIKKYSDGLNITSKVGIGTRVEISVNLQ